MHLALTSSIYLFPSLTISLLGLLLLTYIIKAKNLFILHAVLAKRKYLEVAIIGVVIDVQNHLRLQPTGIMLLANGKFFLNINIY